MLKLFPEKLNPGYEAAVRRMLATARQPYPAINIEAKKPTKPRAIPGKKPSARPVRR
jgi:hypothetical protein